MKFNIHLLWTGSLVLIILIVCLTLVYLQEHSWIIRFEMDNNTLEAIKSINWTAFNNSK
jgi:hypothetical protein